MNLTTERLEQILGGAPEGAIYFDGDDYSDINGLVWSIRRLEWYDCGHFCCGTELEAYREILTLRQRVQELEE